MGLYLKVSVAVVLLALLGFGVVTYFKAPNLPPPDGAAAAATCRQFITDRLGAPSGTRFSDGAERQSVTNADGSFTVTGYVERGGTRSDYVCQVTYSDSHGWRLSSLTAL